MGRRRRSRRRTRVRAHSIPCVDDVKRKGEREREREKEKRTNKCKRAKRFLLQLAAIHMHGCMHALITITTSDSSTMSTTQKQLSVKERKCGRLSLHSFSSASCVDPCRFSSFSASSEEGRKLDDKWISLTLSCRRAERTHRLLSKRNEGKEHRFASVSRQRREEEKAGNLFSCPDGRYAVLSDSRLSLSKCFSAGVSRLTGLLRDEETSLVIGHDTSNRWLLFFLSRWKWIVTVFLTF